MRNVLSIILIMCGSLAASGQQRSLTDSLHYRAELQTTLSTGDHTPLWLNANKYGLSSLKTANGYLRGAVARPLSADDGRKWGIGYGVDMAVAAGFTSTLVMQQVYVEGRWLKGTLTVGAKEYPMELKNQELSSGSQTLGINARPVPQVRIALPEYWTIPGTRNWLALKGHIAYGKTTDDNWQKDFVSPQNRYTEGTFYHSKAGYLKIGPSKFTAELGLEMACQFGGKSYYELSRDDWQWISNEGGLKSMIHAFVPGGGEVNETTYENASGNQLGSWIVRLNYEADTWEGSFYLDHFFEDQSAMFMLDYDGYGDGAEWNTKKDNKYLLYDFKDMMLGWELKLKQCDWLKNIVVEYLYSKYQSGPVYHDRTQTISDHIGGNDNYYNHHIFTGWQHWGQVMGNPLYRSPLYNDDGSIRVADNRFVAWHLGISGKICEPLNYRVLSTYQTGLGTYNDPFTSKQYNFSLLAELSWQLKAGWSVRGALAMDSGKLLGDNFGAQISIAKSGIFAK
ncbi:capsule assembly Wzi family protein [Xylanibacter ruminicola]|uniref:Capsule assembly protein Wzi n=1 Tax=Xylanibacter ruminicola TaxID=839 RepID=A0A1M6XHZ0_XYLRU|nr:capsule assembly Wzi family protein [Xylanibacter ruminicola]SHL05546.1 Capsule assembly protein Wzi [Xylanibacter ruminicola]